MKKPFIRWGQYLGPFDRPFMKRWVINFHYFTIRIHHWLSSDDARDYHDHPWWFLTFVFKGSYTDLTPNGVEVLPSGTMRFRRALYRHRVLTLPDTWTLVITGKIIREWGFWKEGSFIKAKEQG